LKVGRFNCLPPGSGKVMQGRWTGGRDCRAQCIGPKSVRAFRINPMHQKERQNKKRPRHVKLFGDRR
jgi:hypothetical protein